ncbi:MAG: hypothetical protein LBE35_10140 [Clostridiales bacterium]|nr:hypothetical protein [Clostridiales bacterium]
MKIGEMITLKDVINRKDRSNFVTLSPLTTNEDGHVVGGQILAITPSVYVAEDMAFEAREKGERALVIDAMPDVDFYVGGLVFYGEIKDSDYNRQAV